MPSRRGRPHLPRRAVLALVAAAALGASLGPVSAPPALASAPPGQVSIIVSGSPLADSGGMTTNPIAMSPAFHQATHDYIVYCQAGTNALNFTLTAASGTITVNGQTASQVTVSQAVPENDAVVVQAPDPANPGGPPTQYWVRCLPHDFPAISVNRPGNPAGWYLTSNVANVPGVNNDYAMILDGNGTPVWYAPTPSGALGVQLIAPNTLAWLPLDGPGVGIDPTASAFLYHLDTHVMKLAPPAITPLDPHEFVQMTNGDRLMFASPLRVVAGVSAAGQTQQYSGWASVANDLLIDCVVQEINPAGDLVWSWDALNHIPWQDNPGGMAANAVTYNGQPAADAYHCNSIDVDPTAVDPTHGDLLVSMRNMSTVVRVDRSNSPGNVVWKLGGNSSGGEAPPLTISGDPEAPFLGQHDARFQPNGDVSLYDDHSFTPSPTTAPARGVEYHVVPGSPGTASYVWSYAAADGKNSAATGSFRRYSGGTDNVIGWGFKAGAPTMTEVDATGAIQMEFTFPQSANGHSTFSYRVLKAPAGALDVNVLRAAAGVTPYLPNSGVVLDGWGGLHPYGPSTVDTSNGAYWPGWDIARSVAARPDGSGGYTLDGWGGVHAFGSAPTVDDSSHAYWYGWDIARGIALCGDGVRGYILDGWGGVHAFGGAANVSDSAHDYWNGWDIARSIVVEPDCSGGYVLDGWGGIHPFAPDGDNPPPSVTVNGYWLGWDIARSMVLRPDGTSGYVLDGWGGIHGFSSSANVPDLASSAYWWGWDIARSLTLAGDARSGYVVDGWGGLHQFGAATATAGSDYWLGWDIARGVGGN